MEDDGTELGTVVRYARESDADFVDKIEDLHQ